MGKKTETSIKNAIFDSRVKVNYITTYLIICKKRRILELKMLSEETRVKVTILQKRRIQVY